MPDWTEDAVAAGLASLAADAEDPAARTADIVAGGRRRLRRRRQSVALASALLVLLGVGTTVALARRATPERPGQLVAGDPTQTPSNPALNSQAPDPSPAGSSSATAVSSSAAVAPATRKTGVALTLPVAVVDADGVALIRGTTRTELSGTQGAEFPSLSHDARYLSWLIPSSAGVELHLLDLQEIKRQSLDLSGGGGPDQIVVQDVESYAWSPTADVLALCGERELRVEAPKQSESPTQVGPCFSPTWSPDGSRLATVGGLHTFVNGVRTASTGEVSSLSQPVTLPYAAGIACFVGDGLLLWPDPERSASIAADGLTLTDINLTSREAFPLAVTLTYPDWVQPLPTTGDYVVVAGGDREAHDNKRPEIWTIPDTPTVADPPRLTARHDIVIPAKTSLLSVATSSEGTVATVTGPDNPNLDGTSVDGVVGLQRNGPVGLYPALGPAAAVSPTSNGAVSGALVVTATELYLLDASGSHPLGPIGPLTRELDTNAVGPDYYSHVDPATILGQPAAP